MYVLKTVKENVVRSVLINGDGLATCHVRNSNFYIMWAVPNVTFGRGYNHPYNYNLATWL